MSTETPPDDYVLFLRDHLTNILLALVVVLLALIYFRIGGVIRYGDVQVGSVTVEGTVKVDDRYPLKVTVSP